MKKLISTVSLFLIIATAISFLFYSLVEAPFSFNYELYIHTQYRLNFILLFAALLFTTRIKSIYRILDSKKSLLIMISCLLMLIIVNSENYSFSNEHFFSVSAVFLFFAILSLNNIDQYIFPVAVTIIISYLFELGIGSWQLLHFFLGNSKKLPSGTFQNSGIFSIVMVAGLPMMYHLINSPMEMIQRFKPLSLIIRYKHQKSSFSNHIFIVILAFIILLLIVTQSRTAIITFVITFSCLLFQHKRYLIPNFINQRVMYLSLIFIPIILFLLTRFKFQSLSGRMLITQITMHHFWDNFFWGIGPGRFSLYYPGWQSNYFKHLGDNQWEHSALLAGETYLAFNEYLQTFKEIGCIGSIACVCLLYFYFFTKATTHHKTVKTCKLTVAAILVSCVSSYTLHVNFILFLLGFCMAVVSSCGKPSPLPQYPHMNAIKLMLLMIFSSILIQFIISGTRKSLFAERWQKIELNEAIRASSKVAYYNKLYPSLKNDGKFLAGYAKAILDTNGGNDAIKIIEKARSKIVSVSVAQLLAHVYWDKNQDTTAYYLNWIINFVPNKFSYKYDLLSFYVASKQTARAKQTAKLILSMPVKIPSKDVAYIKKEAQLYLQHTFLDEKKSNKW